MNDQAYLKARQKANLFFENNKKIRSLCLGQITLNAAGLMHLVWQDKKRKHKRNLRNQIKRFQLLDYLKPILGGMKYYQEYSEINESLTFKIKGKPSKLIKLVKYWGFVAVIKNKIRIKIILRQVGDGKIHFWSIIPIWKTKYYKGIKMIDLYKGNPKED